MDAKVRRLVEQVHSSPTLAAVVVTGAGSQALQWLCGVAGASRTLLEAVVPYSPASLADFLGYEPEQSVSDSTAKDMAAAAHRRALCLRVGDAPVIGVGCAAAISSDRPKRGDHRCHVAVWDAKGVTSYSLRLTKGLRDRAGEEEVVSRLVIRALCDAAGITFSLDLGLEGDERLTVEQAVYEDPLQAALAGHVRTVTLHPDGRVVADNPVQGGVLSGSFNPLHEGHERLAEAASELLGMDIAFELSATNVDKPPLEEAEVRRRVAQFAGRYTLVITRAPVFYEKARLFPSCTFVIGWDTADRLVDPKYYDGDSLGMLEMLLDMRRQGCRFLVAGRADDGDYHTLTDVPVPQGLEEMFAEIPSFRCDLSSSQLRVASGRR